MITRLLSSELPEVVPIAKHAFATGWQCFLAERDAEMLRAKSYFTFLCPSSTSTSVYFGDITKSVESVCSGIAPPARASLLSVSGRVRCGHAGLGGNRAARARSHHVVRVPEALGREKVRVLAVRQRRGGQWPSRPLA